MSSGSTSLFPFAFIRVHSRLFVVICGQTLHPFYKQRRYGIPYIARTPNLFKSTFLVRHSIFEILLRPLPIRCVLHSLCKSIFSHLRSFADPYLVRINSGDTEYLISRALQNFLNLFKSTFLVRYSTFDIHLPPLPLPIENRQSSIGNVFSLPFSNLLRTFRSCKPAHNTMRLKTRNTLLTFKTNKTKTK